MKKIIFILLLLLTAAPARAVINITATDIGSGLVAIDYSGTELARAFALDITVDSGTIIGITDYAIGDENYGYGIFPSNFHKYITVLDNGQVENWYVEGYTPIADADDPGALDGLDSNGITIEMGSLYKTAAPPLVDRLCIVQCSQSCNLSVTTNAIRGNVVLEDSSQAVVDISGATNIPVRVNSAPTYTGPYPQQWIAVGRPDCWISQINPRQCHGDADGLAQGKENFWVSTNDLSILIDAWNKPYSELTGNQICADFDHLPQGKQEIRVSINDLEILITNWNKANAPEGDCP